MVKLVAMLKRKPGMSREQFLDHWLHRHGPLIRSTPSIARHIVRYEQLPRTGYAPWMGSDDFDGVAVQWFASPADFEAFLAEPAYAELVAPDEASFLDPAGLVWMVTEEPTVVIDGPAA